MSRQHLKRAWSGGRVRRNPLVTLLATFLVIMVCLFLGPLDYERSGQGTQHQRGADATTDSSSNTAVLSDGDVRSAVRNRQSGLMVEFTAEVVRLLPDDNKGSRHQRFLLKLAEPVGDVRTILVAHNIDLAPRVPCVEGGVVTVSGQYEWNEKGGVIHWTHHDPGNRRAGGWIRCDGVVYE